MAILEPIEIENPHLHPRDGYYAKCAGAAPCPMCGGSPILEVMTYPGKDGKPWHVNVTCAKCSLWVQRRHGGFWSIATDPWHHPATKGGVALAVTAWNELVPHVLINYEGASYMEGTWYQCSAKDIRRLFPHDDIWMWAGVEWLRVDLLDDSDHKVRFAVDDLGLWIDPLC